jgi:DNA-binding HxlR family transcriptional regulator
MSDMLARTYDDQVCSTARALEVVGERWSLLLVRDAFLGRSRFEQFQTSLGIGRNVLTNRLSRLVEAGVFERIRYHQHPDRFEYRLTPMGRQLLVPLLALMHWGDDYLAGPAGPPRLTQHAQCGGELHAALICQQCQSPVPAHQVTVVPGPGQHPPTSPERPELRVDTSTASSSADSFRGDEPAQNSAKDANASGHNIDVCP